MNIVEINKLSYLYNDQTRALESIDLSIKKEESVAIIGSNGSGKTTLLLHLNGCLLPSHGEVKIDSILLEKKTRKEIRKKVGMVFQYPDDQLFMTTVYEDVAFGPLNLNISKEDVSKKVEKALKQTGTFHLKDKAPYNLSAGEKRSVAIASVLAMEPEILTMDEPSANLDPKSRRHLINFLQTYKSTKIIATHDLDMVLDLCDRTIILQKGKIVADDKSKTILKNEDLLHSCDLELPLRMQK